MAFELPSFLMQGISNSTNALRGSNDCSVFSCNNYTGPPGCPFDESCTLDQGECTTFGTCEDVDCPNYGCTSDGGGKTVTCTKYIYYDGVQIGSETEQLTSGYTFTPEAHLPSYDSSSYEFDYCSPSGAMTCPNTDFSVRYYFVHISVTCTKEIYYDGVYIGEEYETGLWPGGVFTPSAASHIPSHSSSYEFSYCIPSSFPNGCPSVDFVVQYYFIRSSSVWVYSNGDWHSATPWIYSGGWTQAIPHIYHNGWS